MDRCSACKGPFHPATGHAHSEHTFLCGPCTRHFYKWVRQHTSRKWGKHFFYEHAAKKGYKP